MRVGACVAFALVVLALAAALPNAALARAAQPTVSLAVASARTAFPSYSTLGSGVAIFDLSVRTSRCGRMRCT